MARNAVIAWLLILSTIRSSFTMEEYRAKRDAYLADHGLLHNDNLSNQVQFEIHYSMTSGFCESNISTAKLGVMLSMVNFGLSYVPISSLFEYFFGRTTGNYYLAAFIASGGVVGLSSAARYAYKACGYSSEIKAMDEIKKYLVHKG